MSGTMTYLEATCDPDMDALCAEVVASVLQQVLRIVIGKVLACLLEIV
jgi:hypothetical protein